MPGKLGLQSWKLPRRSVMVLFYVTKTRTMIDAAQFKFPTEQLLGAVCVILRGSSIVRANKGPERTLQVPLAISFRRSINLHLK